MTIQRALQLTTAAVAITGALFLALGHESTWLPALLALGAAVSVLFSDLVTWMRLNRFVSNLLAVGAVALSLYDFLDRSPDQQLMAIAQMLVFLQILLLFQEKTSRTYWQLLVLSLLQVVVAAALSSGPQFGLLLVVYLLLGILSLVLLCIYSDLRLDPPPPTAAERAAPAPAWSVLLNRPRVEPLRGANRDATHTPAGFALLRQVGMLAVAALGFAFVFFYVTPRLNDGPWQNSRSRRGGRGGFAIEVSIEEFGRIHLSNQIVMRIGLTTANERKPYPLVGDPYLQAGVLTRYQTDMSGSRWMHAPRKYPDISDPPPDQTPATHMVRQNCVLELANSDQAFAIMPLIRRNKDRRLNYYRSSGRLVRSDVSGFSYSRELRYSYLTPAFRNGRQLRAIPHWNPARTFSDISVLEQDLHELRYIDTKRFARLKQIAEVVLRRAEVTDAGPLERALALERHFFEPGRYTYSLNLNFRRDSKLDPIEDFISNHHTGHCEYFASALVLMLRSQGIPARMVVGYKAGEFSMLGQYYVVRQKHAHAWVEAWLPPGEVPPVEQAGTAHEGGCWYRLDPTPASSSVLIAESEAGIADRMTEAFDYAELMWRDYVLNLNAFTQQQNITDPLTIGAANVLPSWVDSPRTQRALRQLSRGLGFETRRSPRAPRAIEWPVAMGVGLLLAGAVVAARFGPKLFPRMFWFWKGRPRFVRRTAPEFYLRLERLLVPLSLRRPAGQTPRELASRARQRLARGDAGVAAELPDRVVESYYRVRFGGATLDKQETEAIEHALAELVPAVRQAQKR